MFGIVPVEFLWATRATTQKGAISTAVLRRLYRKMQANWQAYDATEKQAATTQRMQISHNFKPFKPNQTLRKLATKDSNYISELLHIPRNCFDPSKS